MLNAGLVGGAARAARRLHDGLRRDGLASTFLFRSGRAPDAPGYHLLEAPSSLGRSLRRRAWGPFSVRTSSGNEALEPWLQPDVIAFEDLTAWRPEVLHLHWLGTWFNAPALMRSVPAHVPVVWTLHDMQPLTGGCHYTEGCERFRGRCWPCPQVLRRRERLLVLASHLASCSSSPSNLHLVADSHWLEGQARASALGRRAASVRTIHYGLDLETLRPRGRSDARAALGLPLDRPVVLFAAAHVASPRKGFDIFLRVFELLKRAGRVEPELVTFGEPPAGLPGRHFGALDSDTLLSLLYSAADIYVTTTREEAFGQTATEALACGTPVATFAVGGLMDQIDDGLNGIVARPFDEPGLATRIAALLADGPTLARMGAAARDTAVARFSAARERASYRALYEDALSHAGAS